jgi:hypothetical protein
MAATFAVFRWLNSHSNYVSGVFRALYGALVALGWSHLTPAQIGAIIMLIEAVLNPYVEKNTVSTQRVGERIEEKVEQKMALNRAANESSITLTVPNNAA